MSTVTSRRIVFWLKYILLPAPTTGLPDVVPPEIDDHCVGSTELSNCSRSDVISPGRDTQLPVPTLSVAPASHTQPDDVQ